MYFFNKIVSQFSSKSDMNKYLILGIGNIGHQYENTRHNIGFDVLDKLALELKVSFDSVKLSYRAEAKYKGKKFRFKKKKKFKNRSRPKSFKFKKHRRTRTANKKIETQ